MRLWFKSLFNYKNEFLIRTSMHYPERPRFPQQTMCDSIRFALTRSFAITLTRKSDSPVGTLKASKSSWRRVGKYLKNSKRNTNNFSLPRLPFRPIVINSNGESPRSRETFLRSSFGFAVHPPLASEIFSTCRMASVGGSVWNTGMSFVAV